MHMTPEQLAEVRKRLPVPTADGPDYWRVEVPTLDLASLLPGVPAPEYDIQTAEFRKVCRSAPEWGSYRDWFEREYTG